MSSLPVQEVQTPSLAEALERVYRALVRVVEQADAPAEPAAFGSLNSEPCMPLERLQSVFDLSAFERDLVLLCAGVALESRFQMACAAAHKNPHNSSATLSLALRALAQPHWSALSRNRPLRYWHLLHIESGPLLHAHLSIDERILQYLLGIPTSDERLEPFIRPIRQSGSLRAEPSDSESSAIGLIVRHWRRSASGTQPLLLIGGTDSTQQQVFCAACRQTGLRPYLLHAADIPAAPADRDLLARAWTRESVLSSAELLLSTDRLESIGNLAAWLELVDTPVVIQVPSGSPAEQLPGLRMHLPALSADARKTLWLDNLGDAAGQMNGYLDRIVEHFRFDAASIGLAAKASCDAASSDYADLGESAWKICREHARRSLENLAQRIEPRAAWDDLVLPAAQHETLRQIAIHVRQSGMVNETWGFAKRHSSGLGLSVLFSGSSGTGKTMAAEVLARQLDLDLYRIDLSCVVSKYIGETEKNLRKIFDAAEESGAILLFDEADALFGKRSEVRDSHDRYANLEISYLLQRVETYRGVAILTTNMQHAIDSAFLRRIRFIVQFPFPDAPSRARIWQRIFPEATPLGNLDLTQLAQFNVSGGVIRNIAMHAAFLAAEENHAVEARHILNAARIEYAKLELPLTSAETRGLA